MADSGSSIAKRESFSLAPRNLIEAMEFAKLLADSDLVPKDYRGKPGNCIVAIQMGAELGLAPMQAIQGIAVINGRPAVWGDAQLAIVKNHPEFEDIIETDDGTTATCVVKRRGQTEVKRTFSISDAKLAGLFGKQGPWTQYPARMRQMRARGFACRDAFPDALKGLHNAEEAQDIEVKATLVSKPLPTPTSTPTADTAPGSFVIKAGKYKDQKLSSLSMDALAWFAENSKDAALKAAAQDYHTWLTEQELAASEAAAANAGYTVDGDGVVTENEGAEQ